jgi:formylglycine-generating enzyme required for sulfatase activity
LKVEVEALEHQRDKIRRESGGAEQAHQPEAGESNSAVKAPPASESEPASDVITPQPKITGSKPDTLTLTQPFQMEFIRIPAGEFLMGSDPTKDRNVSKNEPLQHRVYLPDYYMAKTSVTNAQYAAFVRARGYKADDEWQGGRKFPAGGQTHSAIYVSWHDVVAFCKWLTQASGYTVRLPTEAEWEKAARGTDGRIFPWGNQWDKSRLNSGTMMRSLISNIGARAGTVPVGRYSPEGDSPYGLVDMAGNVLEWCSTIYEEQAYPFKVQDEWTETYLKETDVPRVVRGGSWFNLRYDARCARRVGYGPDDRNRWVGFRVAVFCF